MDEKLITKFVDEKGNVCGYNTSNATITKNKNDYKMEVTVVCLENRDTKVYYFDEKGICLNCNGEKYPQEDVKPVEDSTKENNTNDNTNNNTNDTTSSTNDNLDKVPVVVPETKVCTNFSDWATIYFAGDNYEVETRTLVKGYKDEVIYGEWSEPTTNKIEENDELEVKTYTEDKKVTSKTAWSNESTTKPASKSGREISSRTEKVTTYKKVCTKDSYTTKILKKWDNSAYKCKTLGIGKVECTYKVKGTCSKVPITKTITYYKYRDKTTKNVTKTYYQSRTITNNITYTDYMLESELPSGYTKLDNSELVQYRYREKCSK